MADAAARQVKPSEEEEFTKLLGLLETRSQIMARLFGILCGGEEGVGQRDETMQCLSECSAQEARLYDLLQERLALADLLDRSHPAPWQPDNAQARARLQIQLDFVAATEREVDAMTTSLQTASGQAREALMMRARTATTSMRATNVEVRQVQQQLLDQQRQREQAAQRWNPEPKPASPAAVAIAAAAGGGIDAAKAMFAQRPAPGRDAFVAPAGAELPAGEPESGLDDGSVGALAPIAESPTSGQPDSALPQGSPEALPRDASSSADKNLLAAFQMKQQLLEQQAQRDGAAAEWVSRHEQLLSNLREMRAQARLLRTGPCALGAATAADEELVPKGPVDAEATGRGGSSATSTSSAGLEVLSSVPAAAGESAKAATQQQQGESTFTPTTGSVASDAADRSLCCSDPGAEARELWVGSVVSDQGIGTPPGTGTGRSKAALTEPASEGDKFSLGFPQGLPQCEPEHLSLVERLWAQLEVTAGHAQASNEEARRLQQLVLEQQQQQQQQQQQWAAQQMNLLAELQELRAAVHAKSAASLTEHQEPPSSTAGLAPLTALRPPLAMPELMPLARPYAAMDSPAAFSRPSRLQSSEAPSSPPTMSRASRLQSREEPAGTAVIRMAEAAKAGSGTIAFIQVREEEDLAWSEAIAAQQALQAKDRELEEALAAQHALRLKDRELEEALAGALAAQAVAKEEVAGIAASAEELETMSPSRPETESKVGQLQSKLQEAMEKVRANSDEVWRLQLQILDRQRQQALKGEEKGLCAQGESPQAQTPLPALQMPGVEPRRVPTAAEEEDMPSPPMSREAVSPTSVRTIVKSGSEVCFGSSPKRRQAGARRASAASSAGSSAGAHASPKRAGSPSAAQGGRQPARAKAVAAVASGKSPSRLTSPRELSPRPAPGGTPASQAEGPARKAAGKAPRAASPTGQPAAAAAGGAKPAAPVVLTPKDRRASWHMSLVAQEVAKGAPALPMVGSPFDLPRKSVRRRIVDGGAKSSEPQADGGDSESLNNTLDLSSGLDGSARGLSPQLHKSRSTGILAQPQQQPQLRAGSRERKPQRPAQKQAQKQQSSSKQQPQAQAQAQAQAQPQPQPQPQAQAKQGTFLHQPQVLHQQPQTLHQPPAQRQPQAQPQLQQQLQPQPQPQPQQQPQAQLQQQSPRAISPPARVSRLSMPAPAWGSQQPLSLPVGAAAPMAALQSPAALVAPLPASARALTPTGLSASATPMGASLTMSLQPRVL